MIVTPVNKNMSASNRKNSDSTNGYNYLRTHWW